PNLKEAIRRNLPEIMNRWAEEAGKAASARGLSQPELRNVVPAYLEALDGDPSQTQGANECLEVHLADRLRQGFDFSEIVAELVLLEQCALSVWSSAPESKRPSDAARLSLSASVRFAILRVSELFHEHMALEEQREKRYTRLLQDIATEALRSPESP